MVLAAAPGWLPQRLVVVTHAEAIDAGQVGLQGCKRGLYRLVLLLYASLLKAHSGGG